MHRLFISLQSAKGIIAVIVALAIGAVLLLITGFNPVEAYAQLFRGAFLDYYGFSNTLVKFTPTLLASLAVILPLRAGLYNIGGEGQMYLGALFATVFALALGERLPPIVCVIGCSVAGILGGALWAVLPAVLKITRGTSEVIVTLLLNYVAINLVSYIVSGPLIEEGAPYPYSSEIPKAAQLPVMLPNTDAHIGFIVAAILAVVLWFVFKNTIVGYKLEVVGENSKAAVFSGINVKAQQFWSLVFGGGFAGLAGAFEVIGLKHRLFHMFAGSYGYDGIVVAFLGGGNPLSSVFAAFFLSGLRSGANEMQRGTGAPSTVVEAIFGLIVIFVAMSVVFKFAKLRQPVIQIDR